jgi:hypothetical protein
MEMLQKVVAAFSSEDKSTTSHSSVVKFGETPKWSEKCCSFLKDVVKFIALADLGPGGILLQEVHCFHDH